MFLHIKSFSNRRRRPADNELVTYDLKTDSKGRPQGENVAFVGNRRPLQSSALGPGIGLLTFAVLFLAFVALAVLTSKLPFAVLGLYLVGSAVAFFVYAWDKSSARNAWWRTPEMTLHILGFIGGWPGALVAQKLLRHKSKKQSFQTAFWVTVMLNCSALGWLFTSSGSQALKSILGAT